MKIAHFRSNGRTAYGVVQGDEVVEIRGSIFTRFRMTDTKHPLSDVKILPPTDPSEIWCPGLNFANHLEFAAGVLGDEHPSVPTHPEPWIKARGSLNGTGEPIILPSDSSGDIHYEGEAVAVIGKVCRRVSPQDAHKFVLGYTCGNDVSDRAWQKDDWTFWRAKGADTFAPVGPWIDTDVDPQKLEMIVRLNGEEVQHGRTEEMLFTFAEIISYISQQVTLRPGDLVFSGSTGVTVALKPGDVVEVEIPGIGVVSNPVEAEATT
ncbi:MAG: fumarylacetoacetate hydrolase family protein [Chloroflexi bacterium]|nr:fumarylacetoacetate hydrolase family protein [Chloroflexota bacterium]MDA1270460.1 fumarylacetoacetate hydrolase family protein [Chloroflexota bacterium]